MNAPPEPYFVAARGGGTHSTNPCETGTAQNLQDILRPHESTGGSASHGAIKAAVAETRSAHSSTPAARSTGDTNSRTTNGSTLLHLACCETIEVVCKLLDLGADPKARNNDGKTPLHCVASAEMVDAMLLAGAEIDARDSHGKTPLHDALDSGKTDVARNLLCAGSDLIARDNLGRYPLHYACMRHDGLMVRIILDSGRVNVASADNDGFRALHFADAKSIVDMLVDAGANPTARDRGGRTPLHFLYSKSHLTTCALLSRGADVNAVDNKLQTPLHRVSRGEDDANLVLYLLNKGAVAGVCNREGNTPLHLAAQRGCDAITRLLLRSGEQLESRSCSGSTPLNLAARYGRYNIVSMIIDLGGNVNTTDNVGHTPLHYAVHKGFAGVTEALVSAGANVNVRTLRGKSPLDLAVCTGRTAIVNTLLKRGADVTSVDSLGQTPLHLSLRNRYDVIMRTLVDAGANLTIRDAVGLSPLDLGAIHGQRCAVDALINYGVDVTSADSSGWTALHYSAKKGHVSVTQSLMAAGASPRVQNNGNASPLDVAIMSGHTSTVAKMIEYRADVTVSDQGGYTALHLADEADMVGIIMDAGADVNAQTNDGTTALMCQSLSAEVVTSLLGFGALPNLQNEDGETVLHIVMQERGREMVTVVDLLLKAGADETILDKNRSSPEHCVEDTEPSAQKARKLLQSAPMDRAWRRRGLLLMCVAKHTTSPRHKVITRSHTNRSRMAAWLLDSRGCTEGVFRTIVGYL